MSLSVTTEAVLDRHLAAFGAGDIDAILENYMPDAAILFGDKLYQGELEIRSLFEKLIEAFSGDDTKFEMLVKNVYGEIALFTWKAETGDTVFELGVDTVLVRGGKIAYQTAASKAIDK